MTQWCKEGGGEINGILLPLDFGSLYFVSFSSDCLNFFKFSTCGRNVEFHIHQVFIKIGLFGMVNFMCKKND